MPVITTLPKPYVGLMGSDNSLQVRRLEDRMVIRLDPGEYFFVVFILVVGGGGLSFLAWYGFPNPHGGLFYTYAKYATGIFAVLLWYILIRYLRGMPRIEVPKGAGEVQFFKYRGGGPEFVIPVGNSRLQRKSGILPHREGQLSAVCALPPEEFG